MKLISLSVYGDERYWQGAADNIAATIYKGYRVRCYVPADAPRRLLDYLVGADVVTGPDDVAPMCWRFLAVEDPSIDHVLIRDGDALPTPREAAAVREWLISGKALHIMRDHPHHGVPIPGGLWGYRPGVLPTPPMRELLQGVGKAKGCDQGFLAYKIYPLLRSSALEHSEYGLRYHNPTQPLPTRRLDANDIVGRPLWSHP